VDDAVDVGDGSALATATQMTSVNSPSISLLRSQIEMKASPITIAWWAPVAKVQTVASSRP